MIYLKPTQSPAKQLNYYKLIFYRLPQLDDTRVLMLNLPTKNRSRDAVRREHVIRKGVRIFPE